MWYMCAEKGCSEIYESDARINLANKIIKQNKTNQRDKSAIKNPYN